MTFSMTRGWSYIKIELSVHTCYLTGLILNRLAFLFAHSLYKALTFNTTQAPLATGMIRIESAS